MDNVRVELNSWTVCWQQNHLLVRENPCTLELGPETPSRFYYGGSKIKLSEEVKQVTSELWNSLGARCRVRGKSKRPTKDCGNHTGGADLPGCATSELQGDGQVTFISELHLLLIK